MIQNKNMVNGIYKARTIIRFLTDFTVKSERNIIIKNATGTINKNPKLWKTKAKIGGTIIIAGINNFAIFSDISVTIIYL